MSLRDCQQCRVNNLQKSQIWVSNPIWATWIDGHQVGDLWWGRMGLNGHIQVRHLHLKHTQSGEKQNNGLERRLHQFLRSKLSLSPHAWKWTQEMQLPLLLHITISPLICQSIWTILMFLPSWFQLSRRAMDINVFGLIRGIQTVLPMIRSILNDTDTDYVSVCTRKNFWIPSTNFPYEKTNWKVAKWCNISLIIYW